MALARVLIAVTACFAVLASPAGARGAGQSVNGRWTGLVPCVPTTLDTNHTRCVGSTLWVGTWTGVTHYVYDGTLNLVSGAGSGTIDETFTGRDGGGRAGTMRFAEMVVLTPTGTPDTAAVRIEARIIDATGGFRGASGRVVFGGLVNLAAGTGTFAGRWAPAR